MASIVRFSCFVKELQENIFLTFSVFRRLNETARNFFDKYFFLPVYIRRTAVV